MHQGSVFSPQLYLLCTGTLQSFSPYWRISFIVKADDYFGVITESLNYNLNKVSELCDLWGIKLNVSKAMTMIVPRSHTIHPQ